MDASSISIGDEYLTEITIPELESIRDNESNRRYSRITDAAIMRKNSYNFTQIASELGVSSTTVKSWLTKMAARGVGEDYKVRLGRPPKFTPEQLRELEIDMQKEPSSFGMMGSRWTSMIVSEHVAKRFGISITPGSMRRLMLQQDVAWPGSADAMRRAADALAEQD